MGKAGWMDVWHMVLALVARQPPFLQIMLATGAVFVAVMAVEGTRTSLLAIGRAHKASTVAPPPPAAPVEEPILLAAPSPRNFSVQRGPRAAATSARKRKPLTVATRPFRSPRPTIRRHPMPDFAPGESTAYAYDAAEMQPERI